MLRIVGMSGWILWVVAGIFENIGVVQEGMETISRENQVVDRPGSRPLVVREGEIRFERRELPLRPHRLDAAAPGAAASSTISR